MRFLSLANGNTVFLPCISTNDCLLWPFTWLVPSFGTKYVLINILLKIWGRLPAPHCVCVCVCGGVFVYIFSLFDILPWKLELSWLFWTPISWIHGGLWTWEFSKVYACRLHTWPWQFPAASSPPITAAVLCRLVTPPNSIDVLLFSSSLIETPSCPEVRQLFRG